LVENLLSRFAGGITQYLTLPMFLKELSLIHFKNYEESKLEFSASVNCFAGDNGSGKTNLLDAIHYLSLCKSYFNPIDSQNIQHEAPFFVIQGLYTSVEKEENIYCGVKRGQKKIFKRNQKEYERLAEHIGSFPIVMISPADSELITEGSESRRKFIDGVISQYDSHYLDQLIRYNRALSQRNTLLKRFAEIGRFDKESLEVWNMQLIAAGEPIYQERRNFISAFVPLVREYYEAISGGKENVDIVYASDLNSASFSEVLENALRRDRAVQHSTGGVHKDDLEFLMNGHPLKKTGSQGQQKTFLLALRLAQFEFMRLKHPRQQPPVLLLDDIHDKLDEARVKKLMQMICDPRFGQVFITDTHALRLPAVFQQLCKNCRLFHVQNGKAQFVETNELLITPS
jgi:DNA replication and repair protein RecF